MRSLIIDSVKARMSKCPKCFTCREKHSPGEHLVTQFQVLVGPVGGVSLPVIIERADLPVRQRHSSDTGAIAVVSVLVLVDVVCEAGSQGQQESAQTRRDPSFTSEMQDVIDRVLPGRVTESIEEPEGVIAAAVDGESELSDRIDVGVIRRLRLEPSDGRDIAFGSAVLEPVEVGRVGLETLGFDFDAVVYLGGREDLATGDRVLEGV